jgi:hypothetical protein
MEDVIAIEVTDRKRGQAAFMTWGRIIDPIDTDKTIASLTPVFAKAGFLDVVDVNVCENLGMASGYPYFYEGIIHFASKKIPYGRGYKAWEERTRLAMLRGKDVYFLGLYESASARKKKRRIGPAIPKAPELSSRALKQPKTKTIE